MKILQSTAVHGVFRLVWFGLLAAASATCSFAPAAPVRPSAAASPVQSAANTQTTLTEAAPLLKEEIQAVTGLPSPLPSLPPVDWAESPACSNQPLTTDEWRTLLATRPAESGAALFMQNQEQDAHTTLEMNIASGRLNRETGIEAADLPDVHTVGDLLDRLEQEASPAVLQASQQVQSGKGITRPVCARMLVTQANHEPKEVMWTGEGIQAAALPAEITSASEAPQSGLVKDSGLVSPDGKKAAFTSLKMDSGGPVFLLDLRSGTWTNLVRAMNDVRPANQPALAEDLWWEIAGWLPDSQRLMLAPADLSSVYVVKLSDYSFQSYPFDGGGLGGGSAVQLAPDGSYFVYFGLENSGGQSMNRVDLATGQVSRLLNITPEQGIMRYPRFAPDGSELSYLVQKGHPLTGLTYSINLYSFAGSSERVLVQGNLGPSVPTWSPDGQNIAFTKKEPDEPDLFVPDQVPPPMRGNIWIVSLNNGALTQLTFIDGWARNPAWDFDARTLAFVTHDGQVGMVSIDQPGKTWLAAEASGDNALAASAIFVP